MKDVSVGYSHNNYISSQKIKALFRNLPYEVYTKNIDINGQKRGCSGFIKNSVTGKICYITTEPFFDNKCGSGLWGEKDNAIMMRTAKHIKDYSGGVNLWLGVDDIITMAKNLTE